MTGGGTLREHGTLGEFFGSELATHRTRMRWTRKELADRIGGAHSSPRPGTDTPAVHSPARRAPQTALVG